MSTQIDWAAPIEPGRGMLGLTLGMPLSEVRLLLGDPGTTRTFANSPRLTVEDRAPGAIYLRAADIENIAHDWQNIFARLIFEQGELAQIMVSGDLHNARYQYKGKLFGNVGLGAPVAGLLAFEKFQYDDVEEVFFSEQLPGLELGGAGACDLSVDPAQPVTSVKVFRSR